MKEKTQGDIPVHLARYVILAIRYCIHSAHPRGMWLARDAVGRVREACDQAVLEIATAGTKVKRVP